MFFKYPYTNLYNLNLDWIIKAIKDMQEIVEPLDRVVNSVNGMTGDVTLTRDLLMQILGGLVTKFNGRDGDVELTAEDVNATLIDIVWTSDPGETIDDLPQVERDDLYAAGRRILLFVNNLGVPDQVYFLQWYDSHAQPQEYSPTAALAGVASFNGMTGNVEVTGDDLETSATDTKTIAESLAEKVPQTRTINNIPLATNISIDAEDIPSQAITGAVNVEMALGNLNASKVPNARTVNGKSLLNDITLNDEDIPSTVDGKTNVEEVLAYQSEEIADLTEETEGLTEDKADIILSSASGAVASFEDGADGLPVESLEVAIEPVQAGTGDPAPDNIRLITGWTGVKLTRTGKNLLNPMLTGATSAGLTITKQPDGSYKVSGTATSSNFTAWIEGKWTNDKTQLNTYKIIFLKAGTTLTYKDCLLHFYDIETDTINTTFGKSQTLLQTTVTTLTIPHDSWLTGVKTPYAVNGESYDLTLYPQIEIGSTATEYEPYQGNTYDITFPSEAGTVYGGTLDVASGVLTVDTAYALLNDPNKWISTTGTTTFQYTESFSNRKLYSDSYTGLMCSYYPVNPSTQWLTARWTGADLYIFGLSTSQMPDLTLNDVKQAASNNNISICYTLDTPITYTLTPAEITTLLGLNNVWADAGDVEVSYRADTKLYIDQHIGDVDELETTAKTNVVDAINENHANMQLMKNTVYQGNVITNTVPSQQATIVRSVTLPAGTYLIIGYVIYDQDFSEYAATTLLSGGSGIATARGTGSNGGEGIPLVNAITLNENTQIALSALQYSATDESINTRTTFLRAIKLI